MKQFSYILVALSLLISVSCGSYKSSSSETELQQKFKEWQLQQNNKTVLETVETVTEVAGDTLSGTFILPKKLTKKPLELIANSEGASLKLWLSDAYLKYNVTNKKKQSVSTKQNKTTTDKGSTETNTIADALLKHDAENEEEPWRPPWWLSGTVLMVLLAAYKVFKTYFKITRV